MNSWRCVGKPVRGSYHGFFKHHHLSFDADAGRQEFQKTINRIFRRNGLAYELPFVTEYKLHTGRPPHRHMPRMRAPTSTCTPWLGPRTPADPAAITGHAVLLKRFNSLCDRRVPYAFRSGSSRSSMGADK
jgi:hypothetical protein